MRVVRVVLGKVMAWVRRRRGGQTAAPLPGCRLYEYSACPFCARVRRAARRLGIALERVDIDRVAAARDELRYGGGRVQVPCLRIAGAAGERWLYESRAIVAYLEREVGR